MHLLVHKYCNLQSNTNSYWITEHHMGWINSDKKIIVDLNKKILFQASKPGKSDPNLILDALKYKELVYDYVYRSKRYMVAGE